MDTLHSQLAHIGVNGGGAVLCGHDTIYIYLSIYLYYYQYTHHIYKADNKDGYLHSHLARGGVNGGGAVLGGYAAI